MGQVVTIKGEGTIIVSDHDPPLGPDGTSKPCYPNPGIHNWDFSDRYLPCASLLGKIGDWGPFEVGRYKKFSAPVSGTLVLGVNDNFFLDNHGSWEATIFVEKGKTITNSENISDSQP